ncbi:MAG: ribosome biogenesis GTPase Der [Candidatus Cloacimonetes bacterium]|nr:ribosome biogenesis GTPase Der [Candidatus Cloacimonadota bacterium]
MARSIVAIVGRPNVGKSTLFNRLCRKRRAIVDFEEGITRDRKYEQVEWSGRQFMVVDTGGINPYSDDKMDKAVRFQAELSIQEADFILYIVDAHTGVTDIDMEIGRQLSPYRDRVMLVANKVDNEKYMLDLHEFMQLGFGEAFPISASQGRNSGNFLDALLKRIQTDEVDIQIGHPENEIHIAIVGKPNVGKSSIVNRLTGEETVIVTDIPGTTRDSIDSAINYFGKKLVLIDTAGLKKKGRIKYGVEYFSSMRTIDSINRADIVVLVMDGAEEVSVQDKKIASYAHRTYRDIMIVVNKWDLVEKDEKTTKVFKEKIARAMPFLTYAPIVFTSALTNLRMRNILKTMLEVEEQSHRRVSTSMLNKFMEKAVGKNPPFHSTGKYIKFFYVTQPQVHPPKFIFFCNKPELISDQYKRYLHNQLRNEFGFEGATIKLNFRGRNEQDDPLS